MPCVGPSHVKESGEGKWDKSLWRFGGKLGLAWTAGGGLASFGRNMLRFAPTFAAALLFFATLQATHVRAQSQPNLTADACVTTREDGSGGYLLANTCDYPIEIAFCSEPKAESSQCIGRQDWSRERIDPRSSGQSRVQPDSALNLFACRTPGAIEILTSGMARCNPAPPAPVIPLLLSASLKNPGAIISDRDYPPSQHDKEGTTRFDLIVGPDGRPVSCNTTQSSGHEALDKTACNAFLKRARFSPAKDGSGNPVSGRYKGSVTWKAP
jgi:TonB family protein